MNMRRDVFHAIADPNRRAIISLLANQQLTINAVAEHFPISRPAISKHIKILAECGLVLVHRQGRERYCEARLDKLNEVADWIEQYQKIWEQRFDRLDEYLKELQKAEKKHGER
jgi:DNA-binding transcriptional ArsR family regulator